MDLFYQREKEKENGYTLKQCLKMFGCSKSGYHAWLIRMKDKDGKRAARLAEEQEIMEHFRKIIAKYGYIPGKRTFHTEMWRKDCCGKTLCKDHEEDESRAEQTEERCL